MKDPRQEAYRAECAAVAGRGVSRLDWPKPYFLFISNLNFNVTEDFLRDELAKWCPPSRVTIPSLRGHSLGLAQVKLPYGVTLDLFLKEFHQKELYGQRINIVADPEAKKYNQAMEEAHHQANMKSSDDASQCFPKKRMRALDSPSFSPASPARPASNSDGPYPSNPKRPRVTSPRTSHPHHLDNRSQGGRITDINRGHGERQFSNSRRDSHNNHEPYHRSDAKNFVNDRPRDYSGRHNDHRDRQGGTHRSHYRNQPYDRDSRRYRHENTRHNSRYGYRQRYGEPYDDSRRSDRSYRSGYRDRHRSPRYNDNGYSRDYSYRGSNYPPRNAPMRTESHGNDITREREWENDYRPAIVLKVVPREVDKQELLEAFRDFYPKGAITDGYGSCTMWFEKIEDRDRAASKNPFPFRDYSLRSSVKRHLVGRRCVSGENSNSERKEEHQTLGNSSMVPSNRQDQHSVDGKEPVRGSDDQNWRRDSRRDMVRRDSRTEQRGSGQLPSRRDPNDAFKNHSNVQSSSNEVRARTSPYDNPSWDRSRKHGGNEKRYSEGKNDPREHRYRESDRNSAWREQRDGRYEPKVGTPTSSGTKNAGSMRNGSSEVMNKDASNTEIRKNGNVDKTCLTTAKAADVEPQRHARSELKADPKLSSKNLSVDEFADVLASLVYQKAKNTITAKRTAVQKSLVNQTVVKFRNVKKGKGKERSKRAALALLANTGKSPAKKEESASSSKKTAHLDLLETFLKPMTPNQNKPPLPDRSVETPIRRRTKRSRFGDATVLESEGSQRLDSPKREEKVQRPSEDHPPQSVPKRRRLILPNSPESSDSGHASGEEKRQNSVDSVASSELLHEKEIPPKPIEQGKKNVDDPPSSFDRILGLDKSHVRHTKGSSLKLSAPSMAEGSIPHLVLSARPPPPPIASGLPGSALTSSEDNTSQEPPTPPDNQNESSQKRKAGGKIKKKAPRSKGLASKKRTEKTSDEEQCAGLLLSLNKSIKKTSDTAKIELLQECGFIDVNDSEDEAQTLLSKRSGGTSKSTKPPVKGLEPTPQETTVEESESDKSEKTVREKLDHGESQVEVEKKLEECEAPGGVGKCARVDVYVRAENTGQHRQRNVHSRTSTSTQSSRECRQENRVYRKGVSRINPKNDIISFNHLKQRRKQVSFGQSMIHGMGLYAKENIDAGEFIIEYVGDLIRRVVADLREKKYTRQGMGDSYLFRLSGDWVIDATRRGGIARFINHSCDPNVYAKIISVVGEPKIVFYSKRPIKEGEELTYDYKFDFEAEDQKIPCLCKAATCRKYLN